MLRNWTFSWLPKAGPWAKATASLRMEGPVLCSPRITGFLYFVYWFILRCIRKGRDFTPAISLPAPSHDFSSLYWQRTKKKNSYAVTFHKGQLLERKQNHIINMPNQDFNTKTSRNFFTNLHHSREITVRLASAFQPHNNWHLSDVSRGIFLLLQRRRQWHETPYRQAFSR